MHDSCKIQCYSQHNTKKNWGLFIFDVKYSKLYKELQFNNNTKYYVVSGSFEDYIKPLFPNSVCVIGSRLTQDHGDRTILGFNCYGEGKLMALSNLGVDHIDVFYTDSYDDLPLVKISKNTIVVSGDDLIRCNHLHEFIDYFKS